ncbi:CASP C terminal-domain-containing protein, partial [Globomyces pollinis-pini]
ELQSRLSILTDDFHRLEKDNVALYEKLRYQENYQSGRMQRPNSYVGINIDSESSSRQRNDVTEKYHNLYEETINPFRQFKNQETVRGQSLNPAERVAMQFTKLLTGNKYSRLLFVAYAILLHFLVFFCMYEVMTQGPAEVKRQGNIHFDKPNTPDT